MIFVDDVQLLDEECATAMACDFESGHCGWVQPTITGVQMAWVRRQGSTYVRDHGPGSDHSLESHYGETVVCSWSVLQEMS